MLLSLVAHAGGYRMMVGAHNTVGCQMHVGGYVVLFRVWQTLTSATPEEDDATSHMHLTLIVLWTPTIILYPMAWATRLSIRTLSLSHL